MELLYTKNNFPSNLNYDGKIVCEMMGSCFDSYYEVFIDNEFLY